MNLYKFITKAETSLFTSAKTDITLANGEVYKQTSIKRSNFSLDSILRKNTIDIIFSGDHPYPRQYIHPTRAILNVHISDLNGRAFYRGSLIMVDYTPNNQIILRFEPLFSLHRRVFGERRMYQVHCPYAVYGTNCGAIRPSFVCFVTELDTNNDRKLTVRYEYSTVRYNQIRRATDPDEQFNVFLRQGGDSTRAYDYVNLGRFTGGLLSDQPPWRENPTDWWISRIESPQRSQRTVSGRTVYEVSFVIYVAQPHALKVNDPVWLSFGCKQTLTDCRDTHNNIVNFGGFPRMTKISPFSGGLRG